MNPVVFQLRDTCDAHDVLSGLPGELGEILALSQRELDAGRLVQWHIPLSSRNIHRVEGLYLLAREVGVDPLLLAAGRPLHVSLETLELAFLSDFVGRCVLRDRRLPAAHRPHYESMLRELSLTCSDPEMPTQGLEAVTRVLKVLLRGARGLLRCIRAHRQPRASLSRGRLPRAVLIGAYGGGHVGDCAILGGVLMRLHDRYGTREAAVASFRPEYTRRWVRTLSTPVAVRVFASEPAPTKAEIRASDVLVFAGGPLTDLPNLLVRQLNAAAVARQLGKPFLIDRVGIGPFPRLPSSLVARRIARLATDISVRTNGAARSVELRGLRVAVDRDPAFDYLAARSVSIRSKESDSLGGLLDGTSGRLVIGVNWRLIGHHIAPSGKLHSREVESRALRRLAEALRLFSERASLPTTYVFFPMNPIQLGSSDLLAAYRLHRLVGEEVDFRVWQADPDVDEVINLLQHLHLVVAMRFHACIFALSQSLPTIGVDYDVERWGKVGELFDDLGQTMDCTRIDLLETEWLVERLLKHAGPASKDAVSIPSNS